MTCNCTLCKRRAGEVVPDVVIEYEKPKVRAPGDPCTCSHCEALQKEREELDRRLKALVPSDAAAQFMFDGD